mmetsp:Transcript_21810/g.65154  ORF Transcript_21810/g.65154 Transcript_21810/m.65154 type:complete len:447 (+) Transcript_21810:2373-3713(+)
MARSMLNRYEPPEGWTVRHKSRFSGMLAAATLGCWRAGLWGAAFKRELRDELRRTRADYDALSPIKAEMDDHYRRIVETPDDQWWAYLRTEVPTETLTTDASEYGWGGHRTVFQRDQVQCDRKSNGYFSAAERELHHNVQEALASDRYWTWYVQTFGVQGTPTAPVCMVEETDNKVVVCAHGKMRTRSEPIAELALTTTELLFGRNVQRVSRFIRGVDMVADREADADSRLKSRWYNWGLRHEAFARLCRGLKVHLSSVVDMFCTPETTQAPLQRSVVHDHHPMALWTDAFTQSWSADSNPLLEYHNTLFLFPPPRLLDKASWRWATMEEAREYAPQAIVIMPVHTHKEWFRFFIQRMVRKAVLLPPMANLLEPPEGRRDAEDSPPPWSWIGILISTDVGRVQDFRERRSLGGDVSIVGRTHGWPRTSKDFSAIAKTKEAIQNSFR